MPPPTQPEAQRDRSIGRWGRGHATKTIPATAAVAVAVAMATTTEPGFSAPAPRDPSSVTTRYLADFHALDLIRLVRDGKRRGGDPPVRFSRSQPITAPSPRHALPSRRSSPSASSRSQSPARPRQLLLQGAPQLPRHHASTANSRRGVGTASNTRPPAARVAAGRPGIHEADQARHSPGVASMSTFDGVVNVDNFIATPSPPPLAYFLSHVHTDHTRGLEAYRSPSAFIYCSAATRALLLRLEKHPHRVNYDRGVLEAKQCHFRHLRSALRPLPLNTPCELHLTPQKKIRVTLLDANHCPGAVMFLIEGAARQILYTGDIRAEKWWVDALMRSPAMAAYAAGLKVLDNVYLDTTYAYAQPAYRAFPPKAAGIQKLIRQIAAFGEEATLHLKAWTLGYEEVFAAIAAAFETKIHVDRYKAELYRSLESIGGCEPHAESLALNGFNIGTLRHDGILTLGNSRFHICDPPCEELRAAEYIQIIPTVNETVQEPAAPVKVVRSTGVPETKQVAPDQILYPYARHSSYGELRELIAALRPREVYACAYEGDEWCAERSMAALFGDLCSGTSFAFDNQHRARQSDGAEAPWGGTQGSAHSQQPPSSVVSEGSAGRREGSDRTLSPARPAKRAKHHRSGTGHDGSSCRVTSPVPSSMAGSLGDATATETEMEMEDDGTVEQMVLSTPEVAELPAEGNESQLTLPDSALASQSSDLPEYRLAARREAYRAARADDGYSWAELAPLQSHVVEDVEL